MNHNAQVQIENNLRYNLANSPFILGSKISSLDLINLALKGLGTLAKDLGWYPSGKSVARNYASLVLRKLCNEGVLKLQGSREYVLIKEITYTKESHDQPSLFKDLDQNDKPSQTDSLEEKMKELVSMADSTLMQDVLSLLESHNTKLDNVVAEFSNAINIYESIKGAILRVSLTDIEKNPQKLNKLSEFVQTLSRIKELKG